MTGSFADWPKFLSQAYNHLRPGGYFESKEGHYIAKSDDHTLSPTSAWARWGDYIEEGASKSGRPFGIAPILKQWLQDAGFQDVTEKIYRLPVGAWPKDKKLKQLGKYQLANCAESLQAFSLMLFTEYLGWSVERLDEFMADVRRDLMNPRIHSYYNVYVFTARKPLSTP